MLSFVLAVMVIVYVLSCLFMIVVILGQEGKGGGLSGLIGASALGDTLGASAAESTLRRWTRNSAILFVVLSLGLTIVGARVFTGSALDRATGAIPEEVTEPSAEGITTSPLAARSAETAPTAPSAPPAVSTTAPAVSPLPASALVPPPTSAPASAVESILPAPATAPTSPTR